MQKVATRVGLLGLVLVVFSLHAAEQYGQEPSGSSGTCGGITNWRAGSGGNYTYSHTDRVGAGEGMVDAELYNRGNPDHMFPVEGIAQDYQRHDHCF
jgi:hypothetical protein